MKQIDSEEDVAAFHADTGRKFLFFGSTAIGVSNKIEASLREAIQVSVPAPASYFLHANARLRWNSKLMIIEHLSDIPSIFLYASGKKVTGWVGFTGTETIDELSNIILGFALQDREGDRKNSV